MNQESPSFLMRGVSTGMDGELDLEATAPVYFARHEDVATMRTGNALGDR
jgi:hypothetical protein